MTITPQQFARAGEILFGQEWKHAMADLLGINTRRVFRIAKAAREGESYRMYDDEAAVIAGHLRAAAVTSRERAAQAEALAEELT